MKKRMIAVLMIICMLLSACGAPTSENKDSEVSLNAQIAENAEAETNAEKVWSVDQIEMPNPDDELEETIISDGYKKVGETWGLLGDTVCRLFYIKSTSEPFDYLGIYVQTLQAPYTKWENHPISLEDWVEGESCVPWPYNFATSFSEDGSLYLLLHGKESDYMGRWSIENGCSSTKIESDWLTESFFENKLPQTMIVGEELGNYFLYNDYDAVNNRTGDNQAIWMDAEFQPKKGLPDTSEGTVYEIIHNSFSDKVYLFGADSSTITTEGNTTYYLNEGYTIWSPDIKEPLFTTQSTGMFLNDKIAFYSENEGYLWNSDGIWQFSIEDQSMKQIITYDMDYTYNMAIRRGIFTRNDGSLLMLSMGAQETYDTNTSFLWEMTAKSKTDVQILELATTISGPELQRAINTFNKQNDSYNIVIRTPEENESFDDYRTRLQAELAAGGGPDLFVTGAAIDLEAGAQKQYLLDLTEYLSEYESVILPSVWQTGLVNGKLYAIPHTCQIITLVTSTDVVGKQTSWTLQEAMEYMEKSGARSFANMENEAGLFYKLGLMTEGNANLIDWEQNASHLNSNEAEKLIEFVTKYADHESTLDNQYQRVADGEVLTLVQYLYGPEMFQATTSIFKNKEVYIGFPTEKGKSGSLISGESIAVNRTCPNVEGAVEFLKYIMSDEVQIQQAEKLAKGRSFVGFPVSIDALEQFFVYLQEADEIPETIISTGGIEYQTQPLSDEKIDILRELFQTAIPMSERSEKLTPIIEEELINYTSGNRSAKEVLDIMQNRTQLYMNENR